MALDVDLIGHKLEEAEVTVIDLTSPVSSYSSFREKVLHLELKQEIEALRGLIEAPDEFLEAFKARCTERETNSDSAVSVNKLPTSPANTLYKAIAELILDPDTVRQLFPNTDTGQSEDATDVVFPEKLVPQALVNIVPSNNTDLREIVLALPLTMYDLFWKQVVLQYPQQEIDYFGDFYIGAHPRTFTEEQKQALAKAISNNYTRLMPEGTLLTWAIFKTKDLAFIKQALERIAQGQRLTAIKNVSSGDTQALGAVVTSPKAFEYIFTQYPPHERFDLLWRPASRRSTLIHEAARNPDTVKIIFDNLPKHEWRRALYISANGYSALESIAQYSKSLKVVLDGYEEHERINVISQKDRSVLHAAALDVDSLKMILALYPEEERLDLLKSSFRGQDCETVLYAAAGRPPSFEYILSLYPKEERLDAVKNATKSKTTLLHWVAIANTWQCLKTVLELYPEAERHQAVTSPSEYGLTVLKYIEKSPERQKVITELVPEEPKQDVVKEPVEKTPMFATKQSEKKKQKEVPNNQLLNLMSAIDDMEKYGRKLQEIDSSKGQELIDLGTKLKQKAKAFYESANHTNNQLADFKRDFKQTLHSMDNAMAQHREEWKPILANILIALTGIGLIVQLIHAGTNVWVKENQQQTVYTSDLLFFAKTQRQKEVEAMEEVFDLMI